MSVAINTSFVALPAIYEGNRKRNLGLTMKALIGHQGSDARGRTVSGVVTNGGLPAEGRQVVALSRNRAGIIYWTFTAADGSYTIPVDKMSESILICLDDAAGTVQNDLVKRVSPET